MKDLIIKKFALWYRERALRKNLIQTERIISTSKAIMRSQSFCFLNTTDGEIPYSRVLQPFSPAEDLLVRFGTSPFSRKVSQLKNNPKGTISYLDSRKGAAVALTGVFRIHTDLETRKKYFNSMWWAFFPNGPEDENYVVLSFKPDRIEIWDAGRGLAPKPFGLKSAAAILDHKGQWILESAST